MRITRAAGRSHHRRRGRQGSRQHGAGAGTRLARPIGRPGRDAVRPRRADLAHRSGRSRASGARRGWPARRGSHAGHDLGTVRRRSGHLPDFRRGSSLLSLPLAGISLDEKRAVNQALLASGATISEMNCVRRHLSSIKGGRLAAACHPARVVTLLISDVPGDDPANIASGPTVCDATTCQDALDIVRRYGILLPASAERLLVSGGGESIKPGDERLAHSEVHMIATPAISLPPRRRRRRPRASGPMYWGTASKARLPTWAR